MKSATLPPSTCDQVEGGVKTTILKKLDIAFAGFRIDKVNEYFDTADSTYRQDGREIHQGVEGMVTGKLADWLTLGGGTVMDPYIKKASIPANTGKCPEISGARIF